MEKRKIKKNLKEKLVVFVVLDDGVDGGGDQPVVPLLNLSLERVYLIKSIFFTMACVTYESGLLRRLQSEKTDWHC